MRLRRSTLVPVAGVLAATSLVLAGAVSAQSPGAAESPSGTAPSEAPTGAAPSSDLRIGLVTDVGTIDDKGFNEYSFEGAVLGAQAIGAPEPQYAISQASADIAPNIQAFVDQDYDVIVTVGFAATGDTVNAARDNPEIKFIGVDQAPCITADAQPDPDFACAGDPAALLPNLQGINWREQQPGFLAGIVAASISETGHIAAVGGTEVVPAVPNYIIGYQNGARSFNPDVNVQVVYASGAPDTAAFNDPAGGQALAQQMLQQDPDIDVFFQVAGKTGNGVLDAACAAGIWAIGVDVDQFLSKPDTAACTVTSAEKRLSKNVSDAIQRIADGTDQGGILYLDISTDDVGLSPFHDHEALITPETHEAIDAAIQGMKDGTLEACVPQEVTGFCVNPPPA
jgi:basic membrane protein A